MSNADLPVVKQRTLLDELHRWRYYLLLVGCLGVAAIGGYIALGTPGFDLLLVGSAVACGAAGVSAVFGLPFAFVYASAPEQRALAYLDNRGELTLGVEYFTPEEWEELTVRWGELCDLPDTEVPAQLALRYDPERHAAWGTHRAIMDPHEYEAMLYQSEAIYEDHEEQLAELEQLRFIGRTLVRRATEQQLDEQNSLYDEFTMPAGDSVGDVWNEMVERKPDAANDGEPTDPLEDDENAVHVDDAGGGLDEDDAGALRDYLDDVQDTSAGAEAATDGGTEDG